MNCPVCETALPDDAVFCGHYGSALRSERACVRCGRVNMGAMRFCLGCGASLAASDQVRAKGRTGSNRATDDRTASTLSPRAYTPRHLAEKILISRAALTIRLKTQTACWRAPGRSKRSAAHDPSI